MKPYIEMKVPAKFKLSPAEVADFLGIDVRIVRRNIGRKPTELHYLKSHQHSPGGTITVYAYDLEDYLRRTRIGITRAELEAMLEVTKDDLETLQKVV